MDQPENLDYYEYISVAKKVPHDLLSRVAATLRETLDVSSRHEAIRKSMFPWLSIRVKKDSKCVGKSLKRQEHQLFAHGPDFKCVIFYGIEHSLSSTEALVIKILWKAYENGTPDVGQHYIINEVCGSESKIKYLRDVFAKKSIYKAIVKSGNRKGTVRLNID